MADSGGEEIRESVAYTRQLIQEAEALAEVIELTWREDALVSPPIAQRELLRGLQQRLLADASAILAKVQR